MASNLFLVLTFCCLFYFPNNNEAGQVDQLRKFSISDDRHMSSPSVSSNKMFTTSKSDWSPSLVSSQDGLMEADMIVELPGQPAGVDFDQYAGYVTVDPNAGRALFYYFVESPTDSASKPLVLWLNGGPGCSSMGYGAMEELGPFRVNKDGKTLSRNYYAWNNVANVLFLESPAGVGFSYSNTTSDYDKSGDARTAEDAYTFLINWLERFPQYKTRGFFITGESYAGHYIPELAETILRHNDMFTNGTFINLQGVAIGNGLVDNSANSFGRYQFFWSHALISDVAYDLIQNKCNFTGNFTDECVTALRLSFAQHGSIDPYNIYAPLCHGSNGSSSSGVAMAIFDPCSDDYVHSYLNNPAVQKAFHANVTALTHSWESCSVVINSWNDWPVTMMPTINFLIAEGLPVWLYSGDIDSVCPILATRKFIKMLGLPVKTSWRPWYLNQEVGGYVEEYSGLTLATVRGAGHMVPSDQPERALTMISSFLKGELPPSST